MKFNYIKSLLPAALAVALAFGTNSCANDLDISPVDPQVSGAFSQDEVFNKLYASLVLSGQKGPDGSADISYPSDEGKTTFYRLSFDANELPTDETKWVWNDPGIPEWNFISWNSSHTLITALYNRLTYNITLCNFFLDQTEGITDEKTEMQRSEARFLRALYYYYLMDCFGNVPFTETFSTEAPKQIQRAALFSFVEKELLELKDKVYGYKGAPFGRIDKAGVELLLARLYLNAEVYSGASRWSDAVTYATHVIDDSGYSLCPDYKALFRADNDENADALKEIIFPIRQDGAQTRSFGGTFFLVATTHIAGMPNNNGGTIDPWSCLHARQTLVSKFFPDFSKVPMTEDIQELVDAAGDDRALFYSGEAGAKRTVETKNKNTFTSGLSIVKWENLRTDGGATHDPKFPDIDIPFFRLAEAYLIRAEANWRNGAASTTVLADLNTLRNRAHAQKLESVDEMTLLDEWAREFYMEGRRRMDLIRFGKFTSGDYVWDWKGGVYEGVGVSPIYNLYPIPAADIIANENLKQNAGY